MSTLSVIAVIDDDASVRAATNNLLRSHGYIVHAFASAEEFLRSTQLHDTSCVIADVQMPTMSGLDLLTLLRAQGYRAPFIFITAFPDESVRARALKAGAISLSNAITLSGAGCLERVLRCLNQGMGRPKPTRRSNQPL